MLSPRISTFAIGRVCENSQQTRKSDDVSAQNQTGKALTNQNVLDILEAGLPPKVLVAKIDRSPAAYDTSPDVLRQLKAAPESMTLVPPKPGCPV
jgi:hypothetical protein